MYKKAKEKLNEKTIKVKNFEEFESIIKSKGGFLKAAWCGTSDCEEKIKNKTGATIRLRPFDKELSENNCICCNKKSEEIVYFAKSY